MGINLSSEGGIVQSSEFSVKPVCKGRSFFDRDDFLRRERWFWCIVILFLGDMSCFCWHLVAQFALAWPMREGMPWFVWFSSQWNRQSPKSYIRLYSPTTLESDAVYRRLQLHYRRFIVGEWNKFWSINQQILVLYVGYTRQNLPFSSGAKIHFLSLHYSSLHHARIACHAHQF